MDTMYRRRTASQGSRTAGRKRGRGLTLRERRSLLQLGASILLFLMVFIGRGVWPKQMSEMGAVLNSDTDFEGAVASFGQAVSEGGGMLEALEAFWADIAGGGQSEDGAETPELPAELFSPLVRIEQPAFGKMTPLKELATDTAQVPEETESVDTSSSDEPAEEPVVTAVAQQYDEAGQEMPDNTSMQYYNLGLDETTAPVMGAVTSPFGFRDHPVSGQYSFHNAVDIGVNTGTDVLAFAAGTVRYIGENSVYGLYVRLDHDNGVSTFYAHCQELLVHKGDAVSCGQVIAKSGATGNATGPHLHFSIDKDGICLDPAYYLE